MDRSFAEVSDHVWVMEERHQKVRGEMIIGQYIKAISVGAIVVSTSRVVVFMVGILSVHAIKLRNNLVNR